ncbi:MAG: ABC transporter ATP-binding protein [Oligoflexia bacterium]|nr:ABC transporter ATP-binding protein [Oligoflexia bacterium]
MSALFEVENLKYGYEWGGKYQPVLKGASMAIPENCFTSLVGPSGTGKTTLLNLMGLLDRPHEGKLRFLARDIGTASESELEELRLRELGFVFQAFHLIPTLTALENTTYFLPMLGLSATQARSRGLEVLEMLGLKGFEDKRPLELSGGQRQRVAIARALAKRPKVILADEPTANLDRQTAEEIIGIFKRLHASGAASFVFSTHDLHLVSYCDQVFKLNDGKVEK